MICKKRDEIKVNERNENKYNDKKVCHRNRKRFKIFKNTNENIKLFFTKIEFIIRTKYQFDSSQSKQNLIVLTIKS
jgi:hypothetical protein